MTYFAAIIGLTLRFYAGWTFLSSGINKWQTGFGGAAVSGYLNGALGKTSASLLAAEGPAAAAHPDVTATWAWFIKNIFLPNADLFAFLVKLGEVTIGAALIIGLFTHVAAGLGMAMCFVFLLSGTASTTGPLLISFLIIFWLGRESYLFGVDRFFMGNLVDNHPNLRTEVVHTFFPSHSYKRLRRRHD